MLEKNSSQAYPRFFSKPYFPLDQFYNYGMQSLKSDPQAVQYCALLSNLIQDSPSLKNLLGEVSIYQTEGNGWGLEFKKIGSTYGLTYEGIEKVLSLLGIENVVVADTKQKLIEAFRDTKNAAALVTDSGLLSDESCIGHAISIFIEKELNVFRLFINDSNAGIYDIEEIQKIVPQDVQLQLVTSNVHRQAYGDSTCYAFAITDCESFINNPKLLMEMKNCSSANNNGEAMMNTLPSSLMSLEKSEDARKKALEFQLMLIKAMNIPVNAVPPYSKTNNEALKMVTFKN